MDERKKKVNFINAHLEWINSLTELILKCEWDMDDPNHLNALECHLEDVGAIAEHTIGLINKWRAMARRKNSVGKALGPEHRG